MFDCFRRIAPSSARLSNDVIPFLARNANEKLASETSRPIATLLLAHPLRLQKNHSSLAKTLSPGILVRSACGKSTVGSGIRSVSCFSSCLAHAQKEFWVILPFHDKGRLPILIS